MPVYRAHTFPVESQDFRVKWLLEGFRRLVNESINAGMNILKTALASNEALARAVRFQPGALRDDVVIPLYDLLREGGGAREEPSGWSQAD